MILQAKAGFHVLQVSRKKQGLCFTSEIGNTLDEVVKETQLKEGWVERGNACCGCSHKSKEEQSVVLAIHLLTPHLWRAVYGLYCCLDHLMKTCLEAGVYFEAS